MDKNNSSFCLVPWIHTYISPQGQRQLCCIADQSFGINKTLDEIWNSDEMKNIRLRMLNGEVLSECNRCNDGSINPNTYKKYFFDKYSGLTENILSKTEEDGTYNELPSTLDYRTNICNFKCKTCSEEFSSQIQIEKFKNDIELKYDILNSKQREISSQIIDDELSNEKILENILEIYWAGGEPMYWKTHWKTLEKLIELDLSKNITLRYSTNLSTIHHNGKYLTEYFNNFKRIELYCSLDATGSIGEWVRTNLNYEEWKKNIEKIANYRDNNQHLDLHLAITVTTPTLFDLENLYELCIEYKIHPDFQTCYSTVANNLLSPKSFPKNLIEPIIQKFLNLHSDDESFIIKQFRDYFNFLLTQDFFDIHESYDYHFNEGIKNILYLDKNRPHNKLNFNNILKSSKPLYNFYKKRLEKVSK